MANTAERDLVTCGHILDALANLDMFVEDGGLDPEGAAAQRYGAERAFEIVSEASRRLSEEAKASEPSVPWRSVADIGNILRHVYDGIDREVLRTIYERDVPGLRDAIRRIERSARDGLPEKSPLR